MQRRLARGAAWLRGAARGRSERRARRPSRSTQREAEARPASIEADTGLARAYACNGDAVPTLPRRPSRAGRGSRGSWEDGRGSGPTLASAASRGWAAWHGRAPWTRAGRVSRCRGRRARHARGDALRRATLEAGNEARLRRAGVPRPVDSTIGVEGRSSPGVASRGGALGYDGLPRWCCGRVGTARLRARLGRGRVRPLRAAACPHRLLHRARRQSGWAARARHRNLAGLSLAFSALVRCA